jgi:signal transduction histidine kinase
VRRADRVLVVDDQEVICEILGTLLRREGFAVATAADGESALARLRESAADVVLLDKNLPKLSGLEVLARIRESHRGTEVILITGYASLDSAVAALRCGAYDYLVKPFADLMEVAEKVRRAAEKARLLRENERLQRDLRSRNQLLEQALGELRKNQKQAEANLRLAALGDAAARVAHELQHPLAALAARLDLLHEAAPEHATALAALGGEISRLEQCVGDLLDLARPRALTVSEVDLAALCRDMVSELAPLCRRQRVELTAELSANGVTVEIDPARIRQLLTNLLRNALDATPSGGTIVVALAPGEQAVELTIADAGAGFAKEALARAGTPFYTTKPHGVGLGLALSRRIAEEHAGRLEIGNRVDATGARVSVWLPRRRPPRPESAC